MPFEYSQKAKLCSQCDDKNDFWLVLNLLVQNITLNSRLPQSVVIFIPKLFWDVDYCPTQSIMHIPFQVNILQESILLIVQYKYLKSCCEDLFPKIQQESDPLHKIMRYFMYYSTQLAPSFQPGRNLPGGHDLYHSCTSFKGASWRGQPLNIFTWFIGSGGLPAPGFG